MNPIGYYSAIIISTDEVEIGDPVCVAHADEDDREYGMPIFEDESVDTPTHCHYEGCEELLTHSLTEHGYAYVEEALIDHIIIDGKAGREEILDQWADEYGDNIEPIIREAYYITREPTKKNVLERIKVIVDNA